MRYLTAGWHHTERHVYHFVMLVPQHLCTVLVGLEQGPTANDGILCLACLQVGGEEQEEEEEEEDEAKAAKQRAQKAAQESAKQAAPGTKLNLHTAKRNNVNILVGAGDDNGYSNFQARL